jgi:formamidopyrimidine-DNA glycosylase
MPELAEVEYSRRLWDAGLRQTVKAVRIERPSVRVFRGTDVEAMRRRLPGRRLLSSESGGKQMLFGFSGGFWLGIHLGMSGELRVENKAAFAPGKHDHFVLQLAKRALVYGDQRHFGRIRFAEGAEPPAWWTSLAPGVLTARFTVRAVAAFLARRRRAPLKAVLLMQEQFPGIGNWMADEILWRARLYPATAAGALDAGQTRALWRQVRWVSRMAIKIIQDDWSYPASWLFKHRWGTGQHCPRCGAQLARATIGGRTTCWCPECQPADRTAGRRRSDLIPPPGRQSANAGKRRRRARTEAGSVGAARSSKAATSAR